MKKKLLVLVLSLSLLLSVFSACANDPADYPASNTEETKTTQAQTTDPQSSETGGSEHTTDPTGTDPETTTTTTTENRIENPQDVEGEPSFNQGIMIMNDRIMELFGLNETGIANYSARINRLRDNLPASVTLYSMEIGRAHV